MGLVLEAAVLTRSALAVARARLVALAVLVRPRRGTAVVDPRARAQGDRLDDRRLVHGLDGALVGE